MRNWNALVRERLGELGLKAVQQEEIIAELAGHLEDVFKALQAQGLFESDASARALEEVGDWGVLARMLHRAKREEGNMNQRTKSVWLPGVISLVVASPFLMILEKVGVRPHIWGPSGFGLAIPLPWLIAQPAFGALGAYLSLHAGGDRRARLVAGLFPSLVLFGAFCLVLVMSVFVDWSVLASIRFVGFAIYICFWVVLPGLALLLGALPFLKQQKAAVLAGN
jgi:hypothetical protein